MYDKETGGNDYHMSAMDKFRAACIIGGVLAPAVGGAGLAALHGHSGEVGHNQTARANAAVDEGCAAFIDGLPADRIVKLGSLTHAQRSNCGGENLDVPDASPASINTFAYHDGDIRAVSSSLSVTVQMPKAAYFSGHAATELKDADHFSASPMLEAAPVGAMVGLILEGVGFLAAGSLRKKWDQFKASRNSGPALSGSREAEA